MGDEDPGLNMLKPSHFETKSSLERGLKWSMAWVLSPLKRSQAGRGCDLSARPGAPVEREVEAGGIRPSRDQKWTIS